MIYFVVLLLDVHDDHHFILHSPCFGGCCVVNLPYINTRKFVRVRPRKDQLGTGCKQILPDSKTKVWVDEQNRINTKKTLGHDKSHEEARDIKHPDPQVNVKPPVKSQKRGTVITSEKDTPQPACALQEFVKHIANPLVDKGCGICI